MITKQQIMYVVLTILFLCCVFMAFLSIFGLWLDNFASGLIFGIIFLGLFSLYAYLYFIRYNVEDDINKDKQKNIRNFAFFPTLLMALSLLAFGIIFNILGNEALGIGYGFLFGLVFIFVYFKQQAKNMKGCKNTIED